MSTWTSRVRRLAVPALVLPLAACLTETTATGARLASKAGAAVLPQVTLFGGDVVVTGPRGYCIDKPSLRRGGGGAAFVLIASCESLTGQPGTVVEPAVMTVSVVPDSQGVTPPSAADIAAPVAGARILHSDDGDTLSLVHFAEGGDTLLPGGDPRHWRGAMLINGHVVGLAVYGPAGGAASGDFGRTLIEALADTLRRLSPGQDA